MADPNESRLTLNFSTMSAISSLGTSFDWDGFAAMVENERSVTAPRGGRAVPPGRGRGRGRGRRAPAADAAHAQLNKNPIPDAPRGRVTPRGRGRGRGAAAAARAQLNKGPIPDALYERVTRSGTRTEVRTAVLIKTEIDELTANTIVKEEQATEELKSSPMTSTPENRHLRVAPAPTFSHPVTVSMSSGQFLQLLNFDNAHAPSRSEADILGDYVTHVLRSCPPERRHYLVRQLVRLMAEVAYA
ncbi:hypothetical protein QR680_014094 [Steinernema hermaphroditum]|uniref:Uncharacterized protein n=1 Tax=Steinernema hermaphroditum TaxID=289476 RepID=A0AA39M3B0_9BILA|nr:hypothetical protein QR680_014094 [Steinernema hermaphroditum]